ncbi:hypothetical protein HK096_010024 [Nowakowskiella sp. JEL0078]|nr:hypothetical protein HK096_010024 [Nowakowskiella sp. JEL0078]
MGFFDAPTTNNLFCTEFMDPSKGLNPPGRPESPDNSHSPSRWLCKGLTPLKVKARNHSPASIRRAVQQLEQANDFQAKVRAKDNETYAAQHRQWKECMRKKHEDPTDAEDPGFLAPPCTLFTSLDCISEEFVEEPSNFDEDINFELNRTDSVRTVVDYGDEVGEVPPKKSSGSLRSLMLSSPSLRTMRTGSWSSTSSAETWCVSEEEEEEEQICLDDSALKGLEVIVEED